MQIAWDFESERRVASSRFLSREEERKGDDLLFR